MKTNNKFPQYTDDNLSSHKSCFCLTFQSAFDKDHEYSHAGLCIAKHNLDQSFCVTILQKWLSTFINYCTGFQMHKYRNMEQTRVAILPFSKRSTYYRHPNSANSQGPLNPAPETNQYIYVFLIILAIICNYFVKLYQLQKKDSLHCELDNSPPDFKDCSAAVSKCRSTNWNS